MAPHTLGKQGRKSYNQRHQSDGHRAHSSPLLAQEWGAAYRPVALFSKLSPMDKVQLRSTLSIFDDSNMQKSWKINSAGGFWDIIWLTKTRHKVQVSKKSHENGHF